MRFELVVGWGLNLRPDQKFEAILEIKYVTISVAFLTFFGRIDFGHYNNFSLNIVSEREGEKLQIILKYLNITWHKFSNDVFWYFVWFVSFVYSKGKISILIAEVRGEPKIWHYIAVSNRETSVSIVGSMGSYIFKISTFMALFLALR